MFFKKFFVGILLVVSVSSTVLAFPTVTPPLITESGIEGAEYTFTVTLDEALPAGYYVAVNFDDQQGDWFLQTDAGGHIVLASSDGITHTLNRTLHKPGLRSFRAGIFDANDTLVGEYSDYTTCMEDLCLQEVLQFDNYGNPELSGSGSQSLQGVDVANGNLNFTAADMSIPAKGPDFTLIRAYNSHANAWSFNLDASVSFIAGTYNRQVKVGPREDGRNQYYFKDMDGKWYALSPGNFDKLIEEADGSFTLYTKGNLYYSFAAPTETVSGRLMSISDRDGNALTFNHASNRITSATDASGNAYTITRDGNGNITRVTDFENRHVDYVYNAEQMITTYTNPRGFHTAYTYSGTKLTSIKDPRDNVLVNFSYYTTAEYLNYVHYVTDGLGNQTEFVYIDQGTMVRRPSTNGLNNNLAFLTDANRTKVTERIDAQSAGDYRTKMTYYHSNERQRIANLALVEQTEDPRTYKTNVSYEGNNTGNPLSIKKAATTSIESETTASWATAASAQPNLTPLTSLHKPGTSQALQYSNFTQSGKARQITNPLNQTTFQAYDAEGKLTQVTDARNNDTHIDYDVKGRPNKVIDALNNNINIVYDALGRVSSQTNARGFTTSYTYDNNGNVRTITDANNGVTTYTYDASDNLKTVKDPRNHTITYEYDVLNRKISESYTIGATTYTRRTQYDAMGRVHKVLDESSHVRETQFDERGQVIKRINPLLNSVTYTYDANGNVLTVTDPEGRKITNVYDALDRVIKTTDPLGYSVEYAYDLRGLLVAKRDKKYRWTTYEYNDLGQMTKVTQPDGKFTKASYDANGNIATTTDRKNQTVTYTYNAINQMTALTDAIGRKWKFTYDANGNMLTRTLPSNKVTSYTYDKLDRVTQVSYPDGQTVAYTYDANGNRLTMQDAQGTTHYTYDELNRLTQVTDSFGNSIGYTFYPTGTLKELIYPDGKKVTYSYDAAGQLSSLSDWLGDTTSYTKDRSGLTTGITYGNGTTVTKGYDGAGRLKTLSNKTGGSIISSHSMILDAVGNPTNIAADIPLLPGNLGRAAEMLYDSSNRLTKIGTKNITHDVDGRVTADATDVDPIAYAYNAQNLITSVINNAVTTDRYTYDGDGKRLARTSNGQTTRYVQDPTGGDLYSLLAESNSANQVQYYYIYGEGLVSQVNGTSHKYYHYDQSGNTLALTDDDGNVTDKYAYEPFGSTTVEGTSHNPFRFVGAYGVMDDGNGLHYMRARYYNTEARRFMSLDARYGQVTDPMALNRYQYVSGNPMVGMDPSGYCNMFSTEYGSCLYEAADRYVKGVKMAGQASLWVGDKIHNFTGAALSTTGAVGGKLVEGTISSIEFPIELIVNSDPFLPNIDLQISEWVERNYTNKLLEYSVDYTFEFTGGNGDKEKALEYAKNINTVGTTLAGLSNLTKGLTQDEQKLLSQAKHAERWMNQSKKLETIAKWAKARDVAQLKLIYSLYSRGYDGISASIQTQEIINSGNIE